MAADGLAEGGGEIRAPKPLTYSKPELLTVSFSYRRIPCFVLISTAPPRVSDFSPGDASPPWLLGPRGPPVFHFARTREGFHSHLSFVICLSPWVRLVSLAVSSCCFFCFILLRA